MSLLWILLALIGLASPDVVTEPPGATEAAPVAATNDETATRANIKQLVAAIESCAATRVDGTYRGKIPQEPAAPDCLSPEPLVEIEPALAGLDLVDASATLEPGNYQVLPVGDGSRGYAVNGAVEADGETVVYAELHTPGGTVARTCGTTPGGSTDPAGECTDGTW